jgi:hypothetical protein
MLEDKLKTGTLAINWVNPNYLSTFADDNDNPCATFNTNTSVISAYYDGHKDLYSVVVDHRGEKLKFSVSTHIFQGGNVKAYEYILNEILSAYPLEDYGVIVGLFNSLFGVSISLPTPPLNSGGWLSKDAMEKAQNEIAKHKAAYSPLAAYSIGTHSFNPNISYDVPPVSRQLQRKSNELPGVSEKVTHPVTGDVYRLSTVIMDLNDNHRWTREQIADWLETLDIDINFKEKI